MPKDAIGSKTQRITEGKSARKPRTRCSFNDEGVLVLLKYINSHLDDFRNDHWKAYKACTEIMLRDPRTEKRYTDRHLSNKVTHILHENMKDGFSARGKRNWLLFTYGTQILDLQDSLWHNKANGIVLSGQLESSLPRTAPDPYDSISNNVVSSGACAGSRKALVVASHRFEPRVQDPGRQAAQKGTNKLREDSLKSTASTQEDGRHCIVVPPPLISGHREGQQQIQKDSVLALLTEQIEVGLFFTGAQEPILRYKLPSVRGAQDNNQQRSFDEEILEPQRKQITYPSAEATNTISIQAPAPSADVDQHAVGHLRILRPPPLWKAFGSDSSSHKNPNLLNDWTDYGLKKTMGDIFGEINATVVAFSCNAEIDLIPGPGYQNLDKEYPDLVRLYKMVFGDHDNGPFGEIIADKAIKAMTRKDWLKALIAAAVTMQVLQADVPEDCYEQNTFLKMMDTVLSVNPNMVAFKKELYREVKMKIVSRPDFVTNEINQKASAMGYALGYALRPMLVRTVPGASMFVSGNAGQPLHTHLEWQRNRLNMYRKCLDLKAQLCHSQESLRFAWPTTGMLFQPWWMKTEYDAPANTRSRVAVALLPALVSDEKKFPLQEGQRCLDYNLVRRDEWVYSRAIVIINDVEGMF